MTLNEKEILGQGFPWLSNRVMAFSRAQWKPGTWTRDASWLGPSESLEATSHIFCGQITVRFARRQLFQKLYFSIIMVWNVNFAKRRGNPGNSFLFSHLQGAQWERLLGQCWHALSPKHCPNVEEYITPSFFLAWQSFLQREPRASLALDISLVCPWNFSSRKEASLLKNVLSTPLPEKLHSFWV